MNHIESIGDVRIRAAVVEKRGAPYKIEELVLRDLRYDEVLVKIVATGMCHTDMLLKRALRVMSQGRAHVLLELLSLKLRWCKR
jgi:threonine dehydrogenase-like Zn-dependent dehydrogenase